MYLLYYPSCNRVLGVGDGWFIKYGWLKHCEAENRWFGSRTNTLRSKDNASLGAVVNILSIGLGGQSSHVKPRDGRGKDYSWIEKWWDFISRGWHSNNIMWRRSAKGDLLYDLANWYCIIKYGWCYVGWGRYWMKWC